MNAVQFFSCSGVSLDPVDVRVAVGDDLFGGELRLALLLGQHRLLGGLGPLGRFRGPSLFRTVRFIRRRRRLPALRHAEHAGEHADHAADRAAEHPADRSRRLVALFCALLNALHHLRIDRRRRAEKHDDNGPQRETQFRTRTRRRCQADHYLVSMVDFNLRAGREFRTAACVRCRGGTLSFSQRASLPSRRFAVIKKVSPQEPVTRKCNKTTALLHTGCADIRD